MRWKRLEILEPLDVGAVRIDDGPLGVVVADLLVGLLARDRVALQQDLPALRGGAGHVHVRPRVLELGARLPELLVELRRLDLGQELALRDPRADVGVPLLEVAAGARVDRRVGEGARGARQHQLVARRRRRDG